MDLKLKRAIGIGALLYLSSFVIYGATFLLPGLGDPASFKSYVVSWVILIPVVLLFSKWYFKALQPTAKRGFQFGIVAILVAFVFDGASALGAYLAGIGLEDFADLYGDWKFYFSIFLIIALTTFAGGEFDGTKSKNK